VVNRNQGRELCKGYLCEQIAAGSPAEFGFLILFDSLVGSWSCVTYFALPSTRVAVRSARAIQRLAKSMGACGLRKTCVHDAMTYSFVSRTRTFRSVVIESSGKELIQGQVQVQDIRNRIACNSRSGRSAACKPF